MVDYNSNAGVIIPVELSASGVVGTADVPVCVWGYALKSGTTAGSAAFRNGGVAGSILMTPTVESTTVAGDETKSERFNPPLGFINGLYVTLAGTGAKIIVYYS